MADDAARSTDGDLLVAWDDHDYVFLMAGADDGAQIHAVHADVVRNSRRGCWGGLAG